MRRIHIPAILLPLLLFAQDPQPIRVDVNLLTIPCVVTDEHGIPVRDLKLEDFQLYDNGVPQPIRNLWLDSDLPLMLGVIIDVSDSQRTLIREHEAAVAHFLQHITRLGDRAFVVAVNEKVTLKSEVTGGPYGTRQILLPRGGQPLGQPCGEYRHRPRCGGTALWNAVYSSARLKLARFNGGKALLILSDGDDTGSTHNLSHAAAEVQRADGVVYAIQYPDGLPAEPGNGLVRLTAETGGVLFDPPGNDYASVLSQIEAELRTRYILGFQPAEAPRADERHRLRIEVTRPGLTVRARTEY